MKFCAWLKPERMKSRQVQQMSFCHNLRYENHCLRKSLALIHEPMISNACQYFLGARDSAFLFTEVDSYPSKSFSRVPSMMWV